jgi:hypothetical protein
VIASSWDYHRGAESRVSDRGNSVRFSINTPSLLQWRVVSSVCAELLSHFLQALSLSGSPQLSL